MKLFVLLGNQLFNPKYLKNLGCTDVYMAEDFGLCTIHKHHKLKLYFFLTAMREYKDELKTSGINVHYQLLRDNGKSYTENLKEFLKDSHTEINYFEIEDKPFELEFLHLKDKDCTLIEHKSPMFLFTREEFEKFHKGKQNFRMASFYKYGRTKFNVLLEKETDPLGGKWSFDEENRKKIPKGLDLPSLPEFKLSKYHNEVSTLIEKYFTDHPGELGNIWFPVTRKQAMKSLKVFLDKRIENFGIYEDAMVPNKNFLFHSTISPLLNIGLLAPEEVLQLTIDAFKKKALPLNSVEGFIRQILGWREFIRGIYQQKSNYQVKKNFWKHKRRLTHHWYDGTTGIDPLDDCIRRTRWMAIIITSLG